jgi:hypothetical protein
MASTDEVTHNEHVFQRLLGIQKTLMGLHEGGAALTSSSRGTEREHFVNSFLARVFPSPFRFGNGDITDSHGNRTGQVDVVVEYPFGPSLPMPGGETRLYLAETVAAVIEVKSNIAGQWAEVESTAAKIKPISRRFGASLRIGRPATPQLPFFAVGYDGWSTLDTAARHLARSSVDGILVINKGVFVSSEQFGGVRATGPWALWGLISTLHSAVSDLKAVSIDPLQYAPTQKY